MATITLIKQLRNWINGTLVPTRVERKSPRSDPESATQRAIKAENSQLMYVLTIDPRTIDRFASYKEKILPKLQENGYSYFRAASSNEYQMHEEWCHEHCESPSLPHCDVWQLDQQYPRAFKSETDATMFSLTFDTKKIDVAD